MSVYESLLKLYRTQTKSFTSEDILKGLAEAGHLTITELESLLQFQQPSQTSGIFISYRRQDSRWFTRQLYQYLEDEFPALEIFWDIELALGEDFTQAIEKAVQKCSVLLVVIGNNWLNIQDEHGQRRLDNAHDYVRLEIASALKRSIPVIPILIDRTGMPQAKDLPENLKDLVNPQALDVDEKRVRHDMDVLLRQLHQFLEKS